MYNMYVFQSKHVQGGNYIMHEEYKRQNVKRSDALKAENIITLFERDLLWLLPLTENKRLCSTKLLPSSFTIREQTKDFFCLFYVEVLSDSQLKITGFQPGSFTKKLSARLHNEQPLFEISLSFVIGKMTVTSYNGKTAQANLVGDIQQRIVPVLIYLQNFNKNLAVKKKKAQNFYTLTSPGVPEYSYFYGEKYKIESLSPLSSTEQKNGQVVVIPDSQNANWLYNWASDIRQKSSDANTIPLYNRNLEHENKLAAIVSQDLSSQIIVHRFSKYVYQLSYFEENNLIYVLLVSTKKVPASYNPVYPINLSDKDASSVARVFLDVLIYLRIESWDLAVNEDGYYFPNTISPMPVLPNVK